MSNLNLLVDFVLNFKLKPDEEFIALEKTRVAFIDSFGVYLAGTSSITGKKALEYINSSNSKSFKNAWINGSFYNISLGEAALVNGTIFHALDLDDSGAFTQGHPSAVIFPLVVTLCKELNLTFKDLTEAYCVGVEVFSRLSRSMPMLHLKGFHPTCLLGTIAATAVVCKLFKATKEEIISSLTLSCSLASGLIGNFGSDAKPLQVGIACKNGIEAYQLSKFGFSGNHDIFEKKPSFYSAFFGDDNHILLANQFNKLGSPLAFINPGINIKFHASCSLSHRAIDSILKIIEENNIDFIDISKVSVFSSPRAVEVLRFKEPKNINEAKFSIPFVLFLACKYKSVSYKLFNENVIQEFYNENFNKKTEFEVHPDWIDGDDWRPDRVELLLKDSDKQFKEDRLQFPNGNANQPIDYLKVQHKFINNFMNKNKNININRIFKQYLNLEMKDNIYKFIGKAYE